MEGQCFLYWVHTTYILHHKLRWKENYFIFQDKSEGCTFGRFLDAGNDWHRHFALQGLHDAGLVHRDVKPLNIIFAEEEQKFKLIDLGACADLRTGTNYKPDESILDSTYCPPEQVSLIQIYL